MLINLYPLLKEFYSVHPLSPNETNSCVLKVMLPEKYGNKQPFQLIIL